jgi:hypothetical protein
VILVDGDLGLANEGRTMRPERFTHTDRLDSTEHGDFHGVGDFATLKMNYGGADVSRSSGFANEDYFVVADRMQSAGSHAYGFNLIGRGTRTVLTNTPDLVEVKWEHGGQQVIEHLVSTHAMSLTLASTYMHDVWNTFEATQRITATMSAANAGFLSVIETGPAGSAAKLAITDLSTANYAALLATNAAENYQDWILSQAQSTLRTVDILTTDAEYAYLRHASGEFDSVMLARGTLLTDTGVAIFAADAPLTLSLWFGATQIRGTISADGLTPGTELTFFDRYLLSVVLNGSPLPFTNGPGYGSFSLPGAGELVIEWAAVPEPSSCLLAGVGTIGIAAFSVLRKHRRRESETQPCRRG